MQRKIFGAVAAGTLLLSLAACGSDSEPTPQASAPPAPATSSASPSASPSPSARPSSSGDLKRVVMRQSDISKTDLKLDEDGIEAAPNGDDLSAATFDYCGGTFDQEGSRVERYAVVAGFTSPQPGAMFNEVVRYGSADEAESALNEFRAAVRDCDGGSYPSVLNDGKDVTFEASPDLTSADGLKFENAIALSDITVSGQKFRLNQFAVQVDDTLALTYSVNQSGVSTPVEKAVGTIGALVATRL